MMYVLGWLFLACEGGASAPPLRSLELTPHGAPGPIRVELAVSGIVSQRGFHRITGELTVQSSGGPSYLAIPRIAGLERRGAFPGVLWLDTDVVDPRSPDFVSVGGIHVHRIDRGVSRIALDVASYRYFIEVCMGTSITLERADGEMVMEGRLLQTKRMAPTSAGQRQARLHLKGMHCGELPVSGARPEEED